MFYYLKKSFKALNTLKILKKYRDEFKIIQTRINPPERVIVGEIIRLADSLHWSFTLEVNYLT